MNGDFIVELFYDQALTMPVPTSPVIGRSELGQIVARVRDQISGNSCWSFIQVEDKLGPTLICTDDTVGCFDTPSFPPPVATDNCFNPSEIDIDIIGVVDSLIECDPQFLKKSIVTFLATDGSGMTAQCDRTFFVERIDTSLIEFPDDRTTLNMMELSCDIDYDLDNDGVLDWELVGFVTYDGDTLAPGNYPECRVTVSFEDTDFGTINCRRKLMRVWTVREWWCNQELEWSEPQLIEIVDTTGPEIVCPGDLTVTTTPGECDASVFLPPATASDNCSAIERFDVTYPGGFLNGQNGGLVNLPVGQHRVVYTVYDECFNTDTCSIIVTVMDATPPIAICDQHTVVSLTNNGRARVPASVFDDGSFDECGIDRFEVRRMTPACGFDALFRDYVEFSCCDLGAPVMVVFRVYDLAGNFNDCMVEVIVQDKLSPLIFCPPNITVSCTFPYSMDSLDVFGTVVALDSFGQLNDPVFDPREDIIIDDPGRPGYTGPVNVGKDGYALGSCNVTITQSANAFLDNCGNGFISRTFTVTNSSGVSRSCMQTISIKDFTPFNENNIIWPPDVDISSCGSNVDPSVTGIPTFTGDDCEMIGISDPPDDWVFVFDDPNNPACFKVLRTWKVIDWCTHDPNTGAGLFTHTQVIKVTDPEPPTIDGCDDVSVCSFDPDCTDAQIDVSITADDDCTDFAGLKIIYSIDVDNDGDFDLSNNNNPFANSGNDKNEASGVYPIGIHRIVWTVEDGCGNFTTCESFFEVRNCTAPTAYCYNGLSTDLGGVDRDGDGTIDWGEVEIWASDFDAGSFHSCLTQDSVILSFSPDTSDRVRRFNCDSIGRRFVTIYATSPNGMQSFCNSFIDIDDNNNVCPPGSGTLTGTISGIVATESGEEINDAEVWLVGGNVSDMTDPTGTYTFSNMPFGGAYDVDPEKDDHYLNGVTANDLSIIQRHVAGIEYFNSPYKYFAADATNDDEVDIRDVLELRKLLLGITSELPNHDPWMFLDADCFFGAGNPLTQGCNEIYNIPNFTQDMIVDFTGIKIGDVDEDAIVNLGGAVTRSQRTINLITTDITLQAGMRYEIPVRIADNADIRALQLTYSLDPGSAMIHDIRGEGMADAAFNTDFATRGLLSQVWANIDEVQFDDETTVIIEFTATKDALLSQVLRVNSNLTEAMAFDTDGKMDVELRFEDQVATTTDQAFELFQNRPNPFGQETAIGFVLPQATQVSLTITDISGRELYRVTNEFAAGMNEIIISKSELSATGVMYYRLDTGKYTATKKMIMLD